MAKRPMRNFEKLEEIGRGAFGIVCKYRNKKSGEEVAVKELQLRSGSQEQRAALAKSFDTEVTYLNSVSHRNIVSLHFAVKTKRIGRLVLDLMSLSVKDLLTYNPQGLDLDFAQHLIFQLLKALKHCHGRDIVHRDVKPGNLLLNSARKLKLADFGMATKVHGDKRTLTRRVGTVPYMAPEIILGLKYGSRVDIWAVGIVLLEIINGHNIFRSSRPHQVLAKVFHVIGSPVKRKWPSFFAEFEGYQTFSTPIKGKKLKNVFPKLVGNPEAAKAITMLITGCHWSRPSAHEILDSKFFKK